MNDSFDDYFTFNKGQSLKDYHSFLNDDYELYDDYA